MTYVCYLIVCIHLLYSFVQAETISPSTTSNVQEEEQELFLNTITAENQDEYLAKIVTPYWNLTYDEQLEKKQNRCSDTIDFMVKRSENLKNLMTYKILPIVPSPVTEAYRNNDEFQVNYGVDGNPKTVGCLIGKLSLGKTLCVRPTKIITIKESHKRVAQVYEDFVRLSPLPATTKPYDGGHWNTLRVRSNAAGEVIACVIVASKGYSYNIITEQQQALKEYFFEHLPNISLFHQVCFKRRCTHDIAPFNILYGKPYLLETLCGYKFQITPDLFFPINKFSEEGFYDSIIRTAKLKRSTTVLDICSGSGINSIMVSKFVRNTFGFESVSNGVTDAYNFAKFNKILNVNFYSGRILKNLRTVLNRLTEPSDVVVILNHRRAGLGSDVIRIIRNTLQISRLLYIFYKYDSPTAVHNFVDLCSYNNSKFPPFRLTKVIPFDLLPQTPFVELILLFERESIGNI